MRARVRDAASRAGVGIASGVSVKGVTHLVISPGCSDETHDYTLDEARTRELLVVSVEEFEAACANNFQDPQPPDATAATGEIQETVVQDHRGPPRAQPPLPALVIPNRVSSLRSAEQFALFGLNFCPGPAFRLVLSTKVRNVAPVRPRAPSA